MIEAYTDGSCHNASGNRGGYGILIRYEDGIEKQWCGGSYINTTSSRCEIRAIVKVLEKIEAGKEVTVYSDSEYCVNTLKKKWIFKWEQENYKGKKNKDLWIKFYEQYQRLEGKVKLVWIKGHNGHRENELCDALAKIGAERKTIIKDTKQ